MTAADDTSAHSGDEKLVFAIDLGTTQTAVSFVHLQPGLAPRVKLVTRWPGQEDASGDCKLPTLVRYNTIGEPVSYGADALENAQGIDGPLVKWFKLHLHPKTMKTTTGTALDIPPLPQGVNLKQVYSHFLKYIYAHATAFFRETSPDGDRVWDRVKDRVEIILAIPNGWDGVQQGFLRDVVVLADVLPAGHDPLRVQFVGEAEASVHYGLHHTDGQHWLKPGTHFCVLDAGGSTVDTTLYKCTAILPKLTLEEVTASECVQAGSVFVDRDAENFLRTKLKNSKFGDDEFIKEMMTVFEKKTKRKFDGGSDVSVIAFGRARDNDPDFNISKGRISLTTNEVGITFQNAIFDISQSFQAVIERAENKCDALLMVGGFSESPYLRKMLREKNDIRGMQTISIDDGTKKAAAEGAAIWYLRQTVVARASRSFFGTDMNVEFNSTKKVHQERETRTFRSADGTLRIGPTFNVWCKKNEIVGGTESRSFEYHRTYEIDSFSDSVLKNFDLTVYACDLAEAPYWLYDESGIKNNKHFIHGIRRVCKIVGDLSGLRNSMRVMSNSDGKKYYRVDFVVEVFFGQTALSADLAWNENGIQRKGPLQLLPDSVA